MCEGGDDGGGGAKFGGGVGVGGFSSRDVARDVTELSGVTCLPQVYKG